MPQSDSLCLATARVAAAFFRHAMQAHRVEYRAERPAKDTANKAAEICIFLITLYLVRAFLERERARGGDE
jgi:hypothetical protein